MDQIEMNVKRAKKVCHEAPFHTLGLVITDIAGIRLHLGLPNAEEVREGVIAHKIAAHSADIARGRKGPRDRGDALSRARYGFDWKQQFCLALDPERAHEYDDETLPAEYFKS